MLSSSRSPMNPQVLITAMSPWSSSGLCGNRNRWRQIGEVGSQSPRGSWSTHGDNVYRMFIVKFVYVVSAERGEDAASLARSVGGRCVEIANQLSENRDSTNSFALKGCKSVIFSPRPMYFTGIFIWWEIPITTPPLAVPSSFVMAKAVISVASANCLACS